ncbi:GTP-binding domain [Mycobacterium phage Cuke]|uniref:SsDNA-binding protein n=1 Tax=Mycobacterium phage Cuke TaxID=2079417 RepID=A0A2L1IX07_9CAUD|nr:GTP-binding domain [Mycobacterium phage Cuke]AVD99714.1 ssDNA-binding protein [Mycobacterium phage Cuke]
MHVIITGSRDFTMGNLVSDELFILYHLLNWKDHTLTVVVGDCPTGADLFTKRWSEYMNSHWTPGQTGRVVFKEFKADWSRACDEKCYHPKRYRLEQVNGQDIHVPFCPVAGHMRNQAMVDYVEQQDDSACYRAFYKQGAKNRGTADCRRRCEAANIKGLKIVEPK